MRWESDFAAQAALRDYRLPQAQYLKPGPRDKRDPRTVCRHGTT